MILNLSLMNVSNLYYKIENNYLLILISNSNKSFLFINMSDIDKLNSLFINDVTEGNICDAEDRLNKGADVNMYNGRAMIIAANIENIPMVKLLLERGANKRLEVAIDRTNNPDVAELLLKAGAVPDKEIYESSDNKIKRIIEKYFPKFLGESNGKYKKLSVLGQGAYGKVFKVKNIETDQDYAMKTFLYEKAEGIPKDVIKELDILQRANHPNIVTARDLMVEECKVEVILELADSSLKKFKGDDDVKLRYVFELLCGVNYLHTNKIIHLDLKPDNLLIVDSTLKIADFGLATIVPNDIYQNDSVITVPYRPPELLKQQNVAYSYEVDIWSVGCIIYELYMEKYLFFDNKSFAEANTLALANNHKYITTKLNEMENKNIAYLIKKCLKINPSSRSTAKELIELFRDLFTDLVFDCPRLFLEYKPFNINPMFTETNIKMRKILYKWLKDVAKAKAFEYKDNTWFLAIDIMDRFWSSFNGITKMTLRFYGSACLSISSKLLEAYSRNAEDYVEVAAGAFTEEQLINAECFILKTLNYIVYRPTLDVLFPQANKEKLKDCLLDNLVPSVIDNDPESISNECVKSLIPRKPEETDIRTLTVKAINDIEWGANLI